MAVTSAQIIDFLLANPGMSDAQIATAMQEYNVTPAQMAAAVGLPTEAVQERYVAAAPNTYTAENVNKLADQILSQGTTEAWTGGLPPETAARYMADELAKSGVTNITQVAKGDDGIINAMTGEKLISGYGERTKGNLWSGSYEGEGNTGFGVNFDESGKPVFYTQGASSSTLKNDVLKLAAVAGLAYGLGGGFEGLFGGAAGTVGSTGLTMAELAQLDLALGGAGGTAGATTLAGALTTGAAVPTLTNLTGGSGVGTLGVTGANGAFLGEGVLSGVPAFDAALANATVGSTGLTATQIAALTAQDLAIGAGTPSAASTVGLLTPAATTAATTLTPATTVASTIPAATAATALTPAAVSAVAPTAASVLTPAAIAKSLIPTAVNSLFGGGTTGLNLGNLFSGGLGTAGSLLQMQESREAAQRAQARIDSETAAAKQAAQFRLTGYTNRFGTYEAKRDPITGELLSVQPKPSDLVTGLQNRFIKLSDQGLTQAEQAQQQFAPLQTGAQNLFSLGNQYISQSPQDVAQNYLNQQMALLQPGRELELANLQNRLQQQGRGGLSVAQGGTMGATTPELQALYNARAQQEAVLAANAQQAGQRDVLFGAGLLGQGSQAMGQYYGGQQAAYAPYTTAFGQVQNLEQLAQQPLQMGAALGQQASAAGARMGELGLRGAGQSVALATGADATRSLGAQSLIAAGNPNAMFGQALGSAFGGLFGNAPVNALSSAAYGPGNAGFQNMLNDIYG